MFRSVIGLQVFVIFLLKRDFRLELIIGKSWPMLELKMN